MHHAKTLESTTRLGRGGTSVMRDQSSATSDQLHHVVLRGEVIGSRDLHAAVVGLAIQAGAATDGATVVLAARFPRMTRARILDEWGSLTAVLRPDVAAKIGLIAFATDGTLVQPDDAWSRRNLQIVGAELPIRSEVDKAAHGVEWTPKTFSVWRVLLEAWLMAEPRLQVAQVCGRSDCSHPTVRAVVDSMHAKGEVRIERDRRVALTGLPMQSLDEIVVNLDRLRRTKRYMDATGLPADPGRLLRRLLARHPDGVLIGGVAAARHFLPAFNLNGLPRLDITLAPSAALLLHELDPALATAGIADVPVLVVHTGGNSTSSTKSTVPATPWAGPSDVFLDLIELQLHEQAVEFANEFRRQWGATHG